MYRFTLLVLICCSINSIQLVNGYDVAANLKLHKFQCSTGENIPLTLVCDGTRNCADGSDEDMNACKSKYPKACTSPVNMNNILITGCDDKIETSEGDLFKEFTLVSSPSKANVDRGNLKFICINGKWISPYVGQNGISEKCEGLPLRNNVKDLYYQNGSKINDNNAHPTGTVIYPVCDSQDEIIYPNVREAKCDENGKWNVDHFNCLACNNKKNAGYLSRHLVQLTSSGPTVICQVHFVSPYLIMTAVSCFDESSSSDYYVYTDVYLNTSVPMDLSKLVKIKKIHYYANSREEKFNHPALAEVTDRLTLRPFDSVMCLDWDGFYGTAWKSHEEGWVAPIKGTNHTQFTSHYPVLKPCKGMGNFSTHAHNSSETESCSMLGDDHKVQKGAGLYNWYADRKYTLRAIVIDTDHIPTFTAVFTTVWKYLDWIKTTMVATDRDYPNIRAATPKAAPMHKNIAAVSFQDFQMNCYDEKANVKFVKGCDLPKDKHLDYEIDTSTTKYKAYGEIAKNFNTNVPEFSSLRNIKCKDEYSSNLPETQSSVCFQGAWLPSIPQCLS